MGECYAKNPFKTIGSFNMVPISAWASLVGTNRPGAQEEYISALSRSIPATSKLGKGFFVGFDNLAQGELCFYRGDFEEAERHLLISVDKARVCDQYVTVNLALVYLMRIALSHGDFSSASEYMRAMEDMLNEKDHGVRYTMYDISYGFYLLSLDQPEQMPEWLKGDFSSYTHPAFLENYANQVRAHYHFYVHRYSALLAFAENSTKQQTILFGNIGLKVLAALSLYQLKRRSDAIDMLTEAYLLAEPNKIVTPFILFAKDMRTLTAAALKDPACKIPKEWLEDVNRKSSTYAKRKTHMISEYKAANSLEEEITLTKRETAVLNDLAQGLSRTEIAASQSISINTVKLVINNIYGKLNVTSLPEAIRTAIDRKIM
jgi:ATP/maltotriose-dependent transcriptional regulator MalT